MVKILVLVCILFFSISIISSTYFIHGPSIAAFNVLIHGLKNYYNLYFSLFIITITVFLPNK